MNDNDGKGDDDDDDDDNIVSCRLDNDSDTHSAGRRGHSAGRELHVQHAGR